MRFFKGIFLSPVWFVIGTLRAVWSVIKGVIGLFGSALFLIGIAALVLLVGLFIPNDGRHSDPLGQVWFQHDPFFNLLDTHSIQLVQVFIERKLQIDWLWIPIIAPALQWPSWAVLLGLGLIGTVLGLVLLSPFNREKPKRQASQGMFQTP